MVSLLEKERIQDAPPISEARLPTEWLQLAIETTNLHSSLLDLLLRQSVAVAGALFVLGTGSRPQLLLKASKGLPSEHPDWNVWLKGQLGEVLKRRSATQSSFEGHRFHFLPLAWKKAGYGIAMLREPKEQSASLGQLAGWILALNAKAQRGGARLQPFVKARSAASWPSVLAALIAERASAKRVTVLVRRKEKWRAVGTSSMASIGRRTAELKSIESKFERALSHPTEQSGVLGMLFPRLDQCGLLFEGIAQPASQQNLSELLALGESFLASVPEPGWRTRLSEWLLESQRLRGPSRSKPVLLAVAAGILLIGALPVTERFEGVCELQPAERVTVVAEIEGRIAEVSVAEGSQVEQGQELAVLDSSNLATKLAVARQMREQHQAEARRQQGLENMTAFRLSELKARQFSHEEAKLAADIERATIRAPIRGRLLTKDLQQRRGTVVKLGEVFCEIGSLERWNLQVAVPEEDLQSLVKALERRKTLPISYRLKAGTTWQLEAEVSSPQQISQMIYPQEGVNVVYVTVPCKDIPEELQLRPGFSGRARIEGTRKPLALLWSKRLVQFLHLHWVPGF